MGLFDRMKEPVFLKESSNAEQQLARLRDLEPLLTPEGQAIIKQDIRSLEYGIAGEKNIAFELKNSHMPMYILHDIYLEEGDLSAQIDYLVVTRKICFIIECKNLYGDIEINSSGDFYRTTEFYGRKKREGIYSPITQNQRHLELLKMIKTEKINNKLIKFGAERFFEDFHKTVVVLANPKTILNAKFAKKEIKDKVIRADQLIKYIRDMYERSNELADSDEEMLSWAQSFLKLHKDIEKDYAGQYEQYIATNIKNNAALKLKGSTSSEGELPVEDTEIYKELRAYRLNKSREEDIKAFYIYSNNQLEDIISKMPKNTEELLTVDGFGEAKVNKYGHDILKIVEKYL